VKNAHQHRITGETRQHLTMSWTTVTVMVHDILLVDYFAICNPNPYALLSTPMSPSVFTPSDR